jgi:phospholipid/cholesterol/gamma-HCH transport system ATP-binding protein
LHLDSFWIPMEAHVKFENVVMRFGDRIVLDGLSCEFPRGKIAVILGGSGSGKSTTLRLIGGLIEPDAGRVLVEGEDVVGMSRKDLARVRLKLGMMFQGGALLDSTTVFDNIALPLREHSNLPEQQVWREVHETLAKVGLKPADGQLLPSELSGGMIKRVALGRAVVLKPSIVLCDEPFAGLDPITAKRIELLLQEINEESGVTLIIVSHDSPSTMRMAHHVLIMMAARAVEGDPRELVQGNDPCVTNLLSGEVDESLIRLGDVLETAFLNAPLDVRSTWS